MSYPGGKGGAGVAQIIINQQPPHSVYIEAFLGSGAVLRAKRPASTNVAIDADVSVLNRFMRANFRPDVKFIGCDAITYLSARAWSGRELVYCDPPYLLSTRKSQKPIYPVELTESDHIRLLETLDLIPCMVQVSGYHSLLYENYLRRPKWRRITFQVMTRRGTASECIWMNYPEPADLHDYRFLGSSFRDRERLKRKASRWIKRLSSLPAMERAALCSALISSISEFGDAPWPAGIGVSSDKLRPTSPEKEVLQ